MGNLSLPPPSELERICKGLATLDAILCDDWESRYYSFDRAWDKKAKHRMASMRNGEGDEWFLVFVGTGAFFKAFWHEYPSEDPAKIYKGIPAALKAQTTEPAFSMDDVTFGGWHDGKTWTLRGAAKPLKQELEILSGEPKSYVAYAKGYFEVKVPVADVAHVLAGKKLTNEIVRRLAPGQSLASLKAELAQIGY